MTTPSISCIILAGGEGKRFNNEDKGLLNYHNKPFIQHVLEHISPQVDDIVISANRNADIYKKYSDKVISDTVDDFQGPLAGISSCIPHCNHEHILVLPCDIPILPDNLIARLSSTDNKLAVARAHEQRQLVFLMHASLKQSLNDYLQQGHHKAMSWIELQNPAIVSFECESIAFKNINTHAELTRLSK